MKRNFLAGALLFAAATGQAATGLSSIRYLPDITVSLNRTVAGPDAVVGDTFTGSPSLPLSGMPGNVAAYHWTGSVHWLVFDTTVSLNGGTLTATPQDVVSYDGTTYTRIFTGSSAGVPGGAAIDALSTTNGSDFLLSFDTSVAVGGVTAAPEDVVRYSGGTWSSTFDGSAAGVPVGANLDALYRLPNGHLLMSFDIAGTVGGVPFGAGDVLEYTAPATWELAYSPAAAYPGWGAANLKGLWAQAAPLVAGTLQFSASSYSGNESGGSITITVTRTGGSSGAVTVQYASSDATATAGVDYTAASGTLSWAAGDTTAKTFTIPILTDALVEGNETVHLVLANPTGGASLGTAVATLTIIDANLPPTTAYAVASPNPLDFGNQTVSLTSAGRTVTVTNTGSGALHVTGTTLAGVNAADFAILPGGCAAAVVPGATCTLTITYTPAAVGASVATLSIASDAADPSVVVNLAGTGISGVPGGSLAAIPVFSAWGWFFLNLLLATGVVAGFRRKETQ
jgi:hypothetical protein